MNIRGIIRMLPLAGAAGIAGAFVITGCGAPATAESAKVYAPVTLNYKVTAPEDGLVGSDGNKHDTFYFLNEQPVHVGQLVTISITNYDDMPHSFTSPELGINLQIPGAPSDSQPSITTYTFTPSKAGTFRWFCAIPCDSDTNGWAMKTSAKGPDQDNFMAGYITVTA